MKTVKKADQAKFDKARKACAAADAKHDLAGAAYGTARNRVEELVVAACPWDIGDIVTSSKLKRNRVFRISRIQITDGVHGLGYYFIGQFQKPDGNFYVSSDRIIGEDVILSLVAYAPPAVPLKAPRVKRLEAALERVGAGENIEEVKQSLGL